MTIRGRGGKAFHEWHVASAMAPMRAPAFDGQAKAAPYTGPDDEPRRRPKYAHLRANRSEHWSHHKGYASVLFPGGPDGNLHILTQDGEKIHEALDGEGSGAVAHQGGDAGLLDCLRHNVLLTNT